MASENAGWAGGDSDNVLHPSWPSHEPSFHRPGGQEKVWHEQVPGSGVQGLAGGLKAPVCGAGAGCGGSFLGRKLASDVGTFFSPWV